MKKPFKFFKTKKDKANFNFNIFIIYFLLSIVGLIFATFTIMNGFHSFDLGQNMRYLECEFNTNLIDYGINREFISAEEVYNFGVKQLYIGFIILAISSFIQGCCYVIIFDNIQEQIDKKYKNEKKKK